MSHRRVLLTFLPEALVPISHPTVDTPPHFLHSHARRTIVPPSISHPQSRYRAQRAAGGAPRAPRRTHPTAHLRYPTTSRTLLVCGSLNNDIGRPSGHWRTVIVLDQTCEARCCRSALTFRSRFPDPRLRALPNVLLPHSLITYATPPAPNCATHLVRIVSM
jgi:hypothetical protein